MRVRRSCNHCSTKAARLIGAVGLAGRLRIKCSNPRCGRTSTIRAPYTLDEKYRSALKPLASSLDY